MSQFTKYDENTAPAETAPILSMIKERYGFVPNLAAYVAESPAALGAVLKLSEAFDQSSLSPREQQVVLLTVSTANGCEYCRTVHTALGREAQLDRPIIDAILACQSVPDSRLEALRLFVQTMLEEKGWLDEEKVQAFLDAGFTRAHVFEVILGIALKTMTNYSNHLAGAEPNPEFVGMAQGQAA